MRTHEAIDQFDNDADIYRRGMDQAVVLLGGIAPVAAICAPWPWEGHPDYAVTCVFDAHRDAVLRAAFAEDIPAQRQTTLGELLVWACARRPRMALSSPSDGDDVAFADVREHDGARVLGLVDVFVNRSLLREALQWCVWQRWPAHTALALARLDLPRGHMLRISARRTAICVMCTVGTETDEAFATEPA